MAKSWMLRSSVMILVVVGSAVMWWASQSQAVAGDAPAVGASTAVAACVLGADEAKYVGTKKCKICHSKTYKSWAETPHANAMESLKPGQRSEAKAKAKLEVDKDYTKDENCVKCHVVGFGKPGGYALESDEKKAKKLLKSHGHIGCETCHGPGGEYLEFHKAIMMEKRNYTSEEMLAAGTLKADENTCKQCHNDQSPTSPGEFDFATMREKGVHDKPELKYRQE
ncbi:MAG: cytochrome c family protein [Planctomycetes bacterium]|nr:cytochrome c family protein [Planctomycetota bacterium]